MELAMKNMQNNGIDSKKDLAMNWKSKALKWIGWLIVILTALSELLSKIDFPQ